MLIKRLLLLVPLSISLFIFQSYFWIPTFSDQTIGSDKRLTQYIAGSIGDAQILNPILHSDASSGNIVDLVFEGLIDRDKDLNFRGRLATSWRVYEEAYFVPRPGGPGAEEIRSLLERPRNGNRPEWTKILEKVEVVPPAEEKETIRTPPKKNEKKPGSSSFTISYPARVKITLKKVDQDLFENVKSFLGPEAIARDPSPFLQKGLDEQIRKAALRRVKLTEHNPIIVFRLRRGVKFHDGHEFDSRDVRFTYDSIMDGRNISPRIPDYEPVKRMETPDRHTVKILYKRLYSPAFGTWQMGVLPEHLLNRKMLEAEARRRGSDPAKFTMRDSAFNRHPIGTGSFRFKEWHSDELIRLTRNENYWEGAPEYKEYIFRIIPDALTQEMAFYAGTVDSYGAGSHQIDRLRKDPRFQVFSGLAFGYTYIGYNMRRKPFDDVRVRRALSIAVDTKAIHHYLLYDQAEDITGPFIK